MPEIRELDAETRDRIAAGEVVERPASVVKELLENALDADAGRIEVAVEAGGTDRIVVSDDGVGMSESDARLAIEEHTTSKLRSVGDLDAIGTLGFRGEALHAIGSVARLRLETKPRGGSHGTELVVENGKIVSCGPTGCPEGTTVEVTNLFGNVPARRKYLKTEATEFDHVARIVTGYALARPGVAVSLSRDGKKTFATTGDGDRRSAVMAVYGREVAEAMIPVDDDGGDGPLAGVEGLVSHPETNRAGREYVTTLIDGRYVTSGAVREAVIDAYEGQLASDRYPFAVVDLELPPGGVDVNVHPRKLEVLFADESGIKSGVSDAVSSALSAGGVLRSRAPRGRSAPEQTEVAPTDRNSQDRTDDPEPGGERRSETGTESKGNSRTERRRPAVGSASTRSQSPDPNPSTEAGGSDDPEDKTAATEASRGASASSGTTGASIGSPASESPSQGDGSTDDGRRRPTTQRTLEGSETTGTPEGFDRLPAMQVLGQFDDTYLVAEAEDGLLLIDQHAADERVNYERLLERFEGDVTTQTLAEPVEVELTSGEAAAFDACRDALVRLGFHTDRVDDRTIRVSTVPAVVAESTGAELIRDVISDLIVDERTAEETVEAVANELLSDLACYPSITGNTSLTEGSVVDLLSALDECENPWACPHGRPVLIHLDSEEIDDRFERDYPGH